MNKVKKIITQIYEVNDPHEAEQMIALGVDHIGSVIIDKNDWKRGHLKEAVGLVHKAGRKSSLIPLYNDADLVLKTLDYYGPDIIHFCDALVDDRGSKMEYAPMLELQRAIRREFPNIKIMRSVPIVSKGNQTSLPTIEIAREFEGESDYLLIDTWVGDESVKGFLGITGKVCDWNVAKELVRVSSIPVILAGGLCAENVYDAIMAVGPYGVDSCTLTNANDRNGDHIRFKKDIDKVSRFIGEVKRASIK